MVHINQEQVDVQGNFLPAMLRLKSLNLNGSPGMAQALMDIVADPQVNIFALLYTAQIANHDQHTSFCKTISVRS